MSVVIYVDLLTVDSNPPDSETRVISTHLAINRCKTFFEPEENSGILECTHRRKVFRSIPIPDINYVYLLKMVRNMLQVMSVWLC